jgi:serine/threonine protein phosphatase PrpC
MSTALELDHSFSQEPLAPYLLSGEGATDTGRVREINEDAYCVDSFLGLVVVADGVGGGERGDIASRMAVETIQNRYDEEMRAVEVGDAEASWLTRGIAAANRAIHSLFAAGRTATTVVAGAFVEGGVHIAHVGDSRALRLRDGELEQLTEDHSLLNTYLRAGVLTPETARTFKLRNVLTRGVGHLAEVEIDCDFYRHAPGDRYVFCTDGLTDLVSPAEISAILRRFSDDEALAAEALCDAAWDAGGHDNVTAVVVRPGGLSG